MAIGTPTEQQVHTFFVILSAIPIVLSIYYALETVFLRGHDPDCTHPRLDWDLAYWLFLLALFLVGTLSLAWSLIRLQIAFLALLIVTLFLIQGMNWDFFFGADPPPEDSKKIEWYYRLEAYPLWKQKFLLKDKDWSAFQKCIIERKVCVNLDRETLFQGGCCVPPIYCGFQQKNGTWVIPESGLYSDDANCVTWSNEEGKLCYNCNTCKASYIYNLVSYWDTRGDDLMYAVPFWILCFGLTYQINMENARRRSGTVQPTE